MAGDNAFGKDYEYEIERLTEMVKREELEAIRRVMMKQQLVPPPISATYGSLQAAVQSIQGAGAARPATLKEQLENIIAGRKSQLTVLEHLLATLNLGAENFYERLIRQALEQVK